MHIGVCASVCVFIQIFQVYVPERIWQLRLQIANHFTSIYIAGFYLTYSLRHFHEWSQRQFETKQFVEQYSFYRLKCRQECLLISTQWNMIERKKDIELYMVIITCELFQLPFCKYYRNLPLWENLSSLSLTKASCFPWTKRIISKSSVCSRLCIN